MKLTICLRSVCEMPGTRLSTMRSSSLCSGKPICKCRQRRFSASPRSRSLFEVRITVGGATVVAVAPPTVILTSNSERDLGDALKRRCLHLHIGFPEQRLEERIVESRVPGISQTLRKQMVSFIHDIRTLDLKKKPSVIETIDWARLLLLLKASELGNEMIKDTLNVLLKYEADIEVAMPQVTTFVAKASRQNVFG